MSGKISANSGFVTKAEFIRLQSKVESVLSKMTELSREVRAVQQPTTPASIGSNQKMSGGVKSWLYSKAGSRTPRGHTTSSNENSTCQNCGNEPTITHKFGPASDASKHIFPKQVNEEGPEEQRRLRNELNQFQTEVKTEIRSLQKSVKDVQELYKSLEKLLNDSIVDLQRTIDRMQQQQQQVVMKAARPDQEGFLSKMRSGRDDQSNRKLVIDGLPGNRGENTRLELRKHTTVI